jgi:L-ornithine N5-oxygenase
MQAHHLIGVGFGPSNIALAIALEGREPAAGPLKPVLVEKQPQFAWHRDMLLDDAHMQIPFLEDLATLRNPTGRFTFINYLHEKGRLQDFINLKAFFPSRREFNDYLAWAAAKFRDRYAYGEEVVEVPPEKRDGEVRLLRVRACDESGALRERPGHNPMVSVGGAPHVDPIMRARSIRPLDDSPFVNEIFYADFVDHVYNRPQEERCALLREFWRANYACPDLDLIESIFKVFYGQKVTGDTRHRFLRRHEVRDVRVDMLDLNDGRETGASYDVVVLATRYSREQHKTLLEPVAQRMGDFSVERNYQIKVAPGFRPAVFLQDAYESSHGLSDNPAVGDLGAHRRDRPGPAGCLGASLGQAENENCSHLRWLVRRPVGSLATPGAAWHGPQDRGAAGSCRCPPFNSAGRRLHA